MLREAYTPVPGARDVEASGTRATRATVGASVKREARATLLKARAT